MLLMLEISKIMLIIVSFIGVIYKQIPKQLTTVKRENEKKNCIHINFISKRKNPCRNPMHKNTVEIQNEMSGFYRS